MLHCASSPVQDELSAAFPEADILAALRLALDTWRSLLQPLAAAPPLALEVATLALEMACQATRAGQAGSLAPRSSQRYAGRAIRVVRALLLLCGPQAAVPCACAPVQRALSPLMFSPSQRAKAADAA